MVPLINVSNYMTSPDALCDFEDTECLCSSREFQGTAQACISEECSVVDALSKSIIQQVFRLFTSDHLISVSQRHHFDLRLPCP